MNKFDLTTYLMKDESLLEFMDKRIRGQGFSLENLTLLRKHTPSDYLSEFAYIVPVPAIYAAACTKLIPQRWFVVCTRDVTKLDGDHINIDLAFQHRILLVESEEKPGPFDLLQKDLPKNINIICDYTQAKEYRRVCERIIMGLLGIALYREFGRCDPLDDLQEKE